MNNKEHSEQMRSDGKPQMVLQKESTLDGNIIARFKIELRKQPVYDLRKQKSYTSNLQQVQQHSTLPAHELERRRRNLERIRITNLLNPE